MKKWWVKALVALGVLMVALWLSFLGSSVKSKNDVERYKEQLRSAGEKLELRAVIPERAPEHLNAAADFNYAVRLISGFGADVLNTNPPSGMKMVAPGRAMIVSKQTGHWDDGNTNSWREIENALLMRNHALETLRRIPDDARIDQGLDYGKGFNLLLPHLAKFKHASQLLSSAAVFELHEGNSAAAASNIRAMLVLANGWDDERLLISELVRVAVVNIALNSQWEMVQHTNVADVQLEELQSAWSKLKFIQPMENAILLERAFAATLIQNLRTSDDPAAGFKYLSGSSGGPSGGWADIFGELGETSKRKTAEVLWRNSWSFSDELRMLQENQLLLDALRGIRTNGSFFDALAERDRKATSLGLDQVGSNWLRQRLDDEMQLLGSLGASGKVLNKVMATEIAREFAISAIALKRYQIRKGVYPDRLEELVPDFLSAVPRDAVDGQPLRYRRNPDGTYLLYSIGEDGKDDGGDPRPTRTSKSLNWQRGADWVWPQPATEAEIEAYKATKAP